MVIGSFCSGFYAELQDSINRIVLLNFCLLWNLQESCTPTIIRDVQQDIFAVFIRVTQTFRNTCWITIAQPLQWKKSYQLLRNFGFQDNFKLGYQWYRPCLYLCNFSCCYNKLPACHHFFLGCVTRVKLSLLLNIFPILYLYIYFLVCSFSLEIHLRVLFTKHFDGKLMNFISQRKLNVHVLHLPLF